MLISDKQSVQSRAVADIGIIILIKKVGFAMSRQIRIFDTTLRDGEQSPGCSMNLTEKLKVATQLELLGVDVIEAGFAAASPGDFESVSQVANTVKNCTVASLSRCLPADIDASAEAVKGAAHPMIHTFLATSALHMEYKLKMDPKDVLDRIRKMVAYARNKCAVVEFSAEDASRSDLDFLCQAFDIAIQSGATVLNVPDTVGYSTPQEMSDIVKFVRNNVPNIDKAIISVHCHNDLGMATANSLAAMAAGASQIECTINGIGERAGNAALAEIAMAIATRGQMYGAYTNIATKQLYRTSSKLARIIGQSIPATKPIVGENAFAHESGIHQHGVMNNRLTYEIMSPESVGVVKNSMVLGKHSGRHAFEQRLEQLGYVLKQDALEDVFMEFKKLCDRKKEVSDLDIEALVDNRSGIEPHYKLERFVINSGNTISSTSIIKLAHKGETYEAVAEGNGPIYASYHAIDKLVNMHLSLEDYSIRSVSHGDDALGEVAVKVRKADRTVTGRGLSTDILESSIQAYLHAINKFVTLEKQVEN